MRTYTPYSVTLSTSYTNVWNPESYIPVLPLGLVYLEFFKLHFVLGTIRWLLTYSCKLFRYLAKIWQYLYPQTRWILRVLNREANKPCHQQRNFFSVRKLIVLIYSERSCYVHLVLSTLPSPCYFLHVKKSYEYFHRATLGSWCRRMTMQRVETSRSCFVPAFPSASFLHALLLLFYLIVPVTNIFLLCSSFIVAARAESSCKNNSPLLFSQTPA